MSEPKPTAKLLGIWGALIAVIIVLTVATRGAMLRQPLGLAAIASIVGYGVYRGTRRSLTAPADPQALPIVNRILRIARDHRGRITPAEVLAETALSLDEVNHTLDALTHAGACQLTISDKGTHVYYFPEFEDAQSKERDALADVARRQDERQKQ